MADTKQLEELIDKLKDINRAIGRAKELPAAAERSISTLLIRNQDSGYTGRPPEPLSEAQKIIIDRMTKAAIVEERGAAEIAKSRELLRLEKELAKLAESIPETMLKLLSSIQSTRCEIRKEANGRR